SDARRLIDWRLVELDPAHRAVRLLKPGMLLDLGGIGKGYAAQRAADVMRARGIPRCFAALAGDLVAGDPPPGRSGWTVAIELAGAADPGLNLLLANAAVSSSGDTEQFIEVSGVRYSHIVDPSTGIGLTHRVAATVIAPRGELADALASAACVLGFDHATSLVDSFPGTGVIVSRQATETDGAVSISARDESDVLSRSPIVVDLLKHAIEEKD
ncbi:MAG: FAD:protein FMN transferase, partial [Phycisphaerales bacterium]|nr:FAD:protein FMN transferase [Phycisphaerales bacterium]